MAHVFMCSSAVLRPHMFTVSCTSSSMVILHCSHTCTSTQIPHPRQPHTCSACCSQLVWQTLLLEVVAVKVSTTHTKLHMYCTVKDLNTHHMLYNGHSVSLNLCMSFAKCAIKWIVVNIILCPIPLPYKMTEVPTCNGF